MAERLSDVEERIDSIGQLRSVVSAYRGIAAARLRDAQHRLDGVRSYAATVADAIGEALGLMIGQGGAVPADVKVGKPLLIALCSEQGFVGNFNTRVLGEIERLAASGERALFLIGNRGLSLALERGLAVDWSAPGPAHAEEVTALANRLAEALYAAIEAGGIGTVEILHAEPGAQEAQIVRKTLIPFDFARFPSVRRPSAPVTTLPLAELVAQLAEEYVFAEICEAVMLSFAAENQTRMLAMVAARSNVTRQLDELTARARRMRQEEITAEVIELAAGAEGDRG